MKFSEDKKRAWLGHPHQIKNMEKKFGEMVQDVQSHKTLGTPKFPIIRPAVESKKISMEDQWDYWSGVGMLFYLVKHSWHNLANATRELSKANNVVNPAAYKELLCVIRYVLGMKNLGLKIKPWGIPTNLGRSSVLVVVTMQETQYVGKELVASCFMYSVYWSLGI